MEVPQQAKTNQGEIRILLFFNVTPGNESLQFVHCLVHVTFKFKNFAYSILSFIISWATSCICR